MTKRDDWIDCPWHGLKKGMRSGRELVCPVSRCDTWQEDPEPKTIENKPKQK